MLTIQIRPAMTMVQTGLLSDKGTENMKRYTDLPGDGWLAVAVPDVGKEAAFRDACRAYSIDPVTCLGTWEDVAEVSYIMQWADFSVIHETYEVFEGQAAIVLLSPKERGYRAAYIVSERHQSGAGSFLGPHSVERLGVERNGRWLRVCQSDALAANGWTYSPADDTYFIIR